MSTLSLGEQREVISLWTRKEDWKLGEITLGGWASVYLICHTFLKIIQIF